MKTQRIIDFLEERCTKVFEGEPDHYVELMMDNHKCVEFNEERYYMPEDTQYDEDEQEVYDYLEEHHLF